MLSVNAILFFDIIEYGKNSCELQFEYLSSLNDLELSDEVYHYLIKDFKRYAGINEENLVIALQAYCVMGPEKGEKIAKLLS